MVLCTSGRSLETTSRHFDSFHGFFSSFFGSCVFVFKQTEHTCHSSILPIIDILCLLLPSLGVLVTRYFAACISSIPRSRSKTYLDWIASPGHKNAAGRPADACAIRRVWIRRETRCRISRLSYNWSFKVI